MCSHNSLSELDLSNNNLLCKLDCSFNQLNCLNVQNGNNHNMCVFKAHINPNLNCIQVDNPMYSNSTWTTTYYYPYNVDPNVSFSTNCFNRCSPTNINEIEIISNIYPNPANDYTQIEISHYPAPLCLLDMHGKIVYEDVVQQSNYRLDVSHFEKGIYLLRIGNESSKLVVK